MSEQENTKNLGLVRSYLKFVDTNVIFKKPVSCLYAISSLLIPVYFLIQVIQFEIFKSEVAVLIVGSILLLLVLFFAGIFGSLIWWHRRIIRDEGPKWYDNFRRFIQTLGEWTATVFAIIVFFGVLIIMIIAGEYVSLFAALSPIPIPGLDASLALAGPLIGFIIIIVTKIILFLLDPIIWLIRKIWALIVRVALYAYRCILKIFGIFEENAPVWIGVNWLIAVLVVCVGLILALRLRSFPNMPIFLGAAFALALGLAYMGFLVILRKKYEA